MYIYIYIYIYIYLYLFTEGRNKKNYHLHSAGFFTAKTRTVVGENVDKRY